MTLFEEIISESKLLTELSQGAEENVIAAINDMRKVYMVYHDGEKDRKGKNRRIIYPFAYGKGTNGKMMVSAYQAGWSTKRGLTKTEATPEGNRWKYFEYDKIVSWTPTKVRFSEDDIQDPKAINDFNPNGDKRFESFKAISPLHANYKGDIETNINPNPIDDQPIKKSDIQHVNVQPSQVQAVQKNQPSQQNNIDNEPANDYTNKGFEAPDARPITKSEIEGDSFISSTNEPNDELNNEPNNEPQISDKPISKTEIEDNEPTGEATDNNEEDEKVKSVSEITKTFKNLLERMEKLNKD